MSTLGFYYKVQLFNMPSLMGNESFIGSGMRVNISQLGEIRAYVSVITEVNSLLIPLKEMLL